MSQNIRLNDTTNEESKLVVIEQGGAPFIGLGRIYKNYDFTTSKGRYRYSEMNKAYYEIGKELIDILSKGRVCYLGACWQKTSLAKRDFFDRWTPPVFVEDGEMQKFKQELKSDVWGKQLWADYMWYFENPNKTFFLRVPYMSRHYYREIAVVQEKLEMSLVEKMSMCGQEEHKSMSVRIFPHSKIEHLENDNETVRSYIHSDDFIIHIAPTSMKSNLHIEINHNYMSLNEFIEIVEPLFEKRGMKIVDKTDPYIYHGFPTDYVEHNVYPPCAGYQFFD